MKNLQKGFIVPLLLVIIAVLLAGGGTYVYTQQKQDNQAVVPNGSEQKTSTTQAIPTTQTQVVNTAPNTTAQAPSVTVLSPNGGEIWRVGDTYDIRWSAPGVSSIYIILENNTGYGEVNIAQGIDASKGVYSWMVPTTVVPGSDYSVRVEGGSFIEAKGARRYDDSSNAPFTITK